MKTLEARSAAPAGVAYLEGESVRFSRSAGGLLSLTHMTEEGEVRYDRVIVLRAFPLTAPEEYLSVREPTEGKREIGMLRRLRDLDEESERLVSEELEKRYYVPKITRIHSLHRRRAVFIDADTDLGRRRITLSDGVNAVRPLEDGRLLFNDVEGNTFEIPDPRALDKASYRKIEVFL